MTEDRGAEERLEARAALVGAIAVGLGRHLLHPLAGPLGAEIDTQRALGGWERATTPLETGWYSVQRCVSVATANAQTLVRWGASLPAHSATGGLLARGALEVLSVAAWLLDPTEPDLVRSRRALAEVRYSTRRLKQLYKADGRQAEADGATSGLDVLEREERRLVGPDHKLCERPEHAKLVGRLFDASAESNPADHDPSWTVIYRHLSALAHGTRWGVDHYSSLVDNGTQRDLSATPQLVDLLLFHVGVGLAVVGHSAHEQLEWAHPAEYGAVEFFDLGPPDTDFGE